MAGNFDFLFDPGNCFFELERQRVTEILTPTTASRPATAEEFAENIAEDVFEAAGEIEAASREWSAVAESRMPELIVL
jgi:hypothetical protein